MPLDEYADEHITILDTRWKLFMTFKYDQQFIYGAKAKLRAITAPIIIIKPG